MSDWRASKREGLEALRDSASEIQNVLAQLDTFVGRVKEEAEGLEMSEEDRRKVQEVLDGYAHHRRQLDAERRRVTSLLKELRRASEAKASRLGVALQERAHEPARLVSEFNEYHDSTWRELRESRGPDEGVTE